MYAHFNGGGEGGRRAHWQLVAPCGSAADPNSAFGIDAQGAVRRRPNLNPTSRSDVHRPPLHLQPAIAPQVDVLARHLQWLIDTGTYREKNFFYLYFNID